MLAQGLGLEIFTWSSSRASSAESGAVACASRSLPAPFACGGTHMLSSGFRVEEQPAPSVCGSTWSSDFSERRGAWEAGRGGVHWASGGEVVGLQTAELRAAIVQVPCDMHNVRCFSAWNSCYGLSCSIWYDNMSVLGSARARDAPLLLLLRGGRRTGNGEA